MSDQVERQESPEEALGEAVEQVDIQESLEETTESIEAKAPALNAEEPAAPDVVHVDERGAQVVEAQVVHVDSGAIGKATAETIEVKEGAIGIAQGGTITVHEGAIGIAFAERAEVHEGAVLFMLAEEVGGETRVLFDLRAAVLFGLIVGLVSGLFKLFAGRKGD